MQLSSIGKLLRLGHDRSPWISNLSLDETEKPILCSNNIWDEAWVKRVKRAATAKNISMMGIVITIKKKKKQVLKYAEKMNMNNYYTTKTNTTHLLEKEVLLGYRQFRRIDLQEKKCLEDNLHRTKKGNNEKKTEN